MKSFQRSFWLANMMEMLERLAFYGVRAVVGIYIIEGARLGGLELTHTQRGTIFSVWAIIQMLLPMFTGGFSDRYGYKLSLYIAFGINVIGYTTMGIATGYGSFFAGVILVATGTAIFKPPLHGTLAHVVDERNSSVGWGIFYQIVNIGGFLGPIIAAQLRMITWDYVFFASAIWTALNFIPTIFFFKDYSKELRAAKAADTAEQKGPLATFADSMITLLLDKKFVAFLLIFSGFWLMFIQLFDTLPIFIDEWVDSRAIVTALGITADRYGNVPPEMMINIDAGAIVLVMPIIGYLTGKFKPIVMMVVGMLLSTLTLAFTGAMNIGWLVALGIFLFAVGEMICSPKFSEYIGLMAPPEKKALYMGYSNIPFAIGMALGGLLSGLLYGQYSDKYKFGREHLVEEMGANAAFVKALDRTEVMPTLAALMEAEGEQWRAYEDPAAFGRDFALRELRLERTTLATAMADQAISWLEFRLDKGKVESGLGLEMAEIRAKLTTDSEDWLDVGAGLEPAPTGNEKPDAAPPGAEPATESAIGSGVASGAAPSAGHEATNSLSELLEKAEAPDELRQGIRTAGREAVFVAIGKKVDTFAATRLLWDRYHPWITWLIFGAIGLAATIGMLFYHFWLEADAKRRRAASGDA